MKEPKTNLKATNMEIDSDVREYFFKRIQTLSKFINFDDPTLIMDVELGKVSLHHQKGDVFRAEVTITLAGQQYRAESTKEDLFTAIDEVKSELENVMQKNKKKRISFIRRGGTRIKNLLRGWIGR
ncbi:MAG: ribosomal subunit interface protein [Parcubacteria group bacterium CG11_big_fil_rev_8_21_14_0_20_39_22]|nr:MAG: ribosomal subunit interface protein [Parcubacteria group bacterium CG11_big_fil_rev_8_21_14_0_20_39_22]